ncbi:ras-related protein Rab-28-like [Paramacrobiotus metropolitanus]|uniref:ras-related protein Rab-28-like n=1 Tax=Paramacrobiotus metropolitanus TaxID=2943436 RepID=UPI0024464546|nr:ras-related protein Rab-28-like [Paramacrobiotus metropolitanus]
MDSDSERNYQEAVLKIVFLGEPGVGKTSIIHRYLNDQFSGDSIQTSGVEFHRKRISFPGNTDVSLHIWDTGGAALISGMLSSYLHEAHVLVFVYDITNTNSFVKLTDWFEMIQKYYPPTVDGSSKRKDPFMAVIGNKSDLQHLRTIKPERAMKFAQERGVAETGVISAQSNDGVHVLFRKITATVLGLRLGRADFEQDIVAAQLPQNSRDPNPIIRPTGNPSRSSICAIS